MARDGLFVVLVREDGADEANDGRVVGENTDDVAAALDLFVEPFERVVRPELAAVRARERVRVSSLNHEFSA